MYYQQHFAQDSEQYRRFRPDYPAALFDYLVGLTKSQQLAWDCATGSGQAASPLSQRFKQVIATDLQFQQLEHADPKDNVLLCQCLAEMPALKEKSVDLITVAQALHWFDFEQFYPQVEKVLKPDGIFAAWCYPLAHITPEIDAIIMRLYNDILGDTYWPPERRYIDAGYSSIPFPFKKIKTPEFSMEKKMNLLQLMGYLQTWSAVKEFTHRNQSNPITMIKADLEAAFGDPNLVQTVRWPLHLLVGKQ